MKIKITLGISLAAEAGSALHSAADACDRHMRDNPMCDKAYWRERRDHLRRQAVEFDKIYKDAEPVFE